MKYFYSKFLIFLLGFFLHTAAVLGQAPPVTTVGAATFATGTYSVPITVSGFTNVANISLKLLYDNTKLIYTGITLNSGLVPANAITTPATDQSGAFVLSYSSATAITLGAPVNTLLTLTFTVQPGVEGVHTPLNWSTAQGACDMTPPPPGAFVPLISPANLSTYFINGFIDIPPVPVIGGPNAACTGSTGNIYSTKAGMSAYTWTVSAGGTITAGAGTDAITVTWGTAGAQSVSVNYTDPLAGPAAAPTLLPVNVAAAISPTPWGPVSVCAGSAGNVYSTNPGMTGYVWNVSAGGTITAGAGTNSITVTWNTAGAQSVSVNFTPAAGCTATPVALPVTVNALPVPTITGLAAVCVGSTGVTYTTEPSMMSYTWSVSAGGAITSGTGTNSITVNWLAAGAQNVSVNYINAGGCTAAAPVSLPVAVSAVPVPTITGSLSICAGSAGINYTTEAGMTNYQWTISAGGLITAGAGTNSITVTWNTAGPQTVSVNYSNASLCTAVVPAVANITVNPIPVPTITGPLDPLTLLPATLAGGVTTGQVYTTELSMTGYTWTVSPAGTITAGAGTNAITVTWTNPTSQQSVTVNYTGGSGCPSAAPTVYIINYYPFAGPVDPTTVPQFVDPLPHFAAGLRVNAKAGGNLLIKEVPVHQVALSTGTVLANGTIGNPLTPDAGKGTYAAYAISKDNGATFGPAMWPAQTIEAQVNNQLTVQYRNDLFGLTYDNFNILADQTLMMNGYPQNGNIYTDPYRGPIPMVVHLHGGEMPSNSDGGPTAWFTPGYSLLGPGFLYNASSLSTYPNKQEEGTLWYHPHDQGLTRINVYTGLAGFYFLRGPAEEAAHLPGWSGDDKVQEVTPAGKSPTFNGTNAYLPEIEVAIQDRMFNTKGELYWPVAPTNPDVHPFWTPEFYGDIMTVNGKSWPYLSVAPRKYRFRLLDGCNARFLNVWLMNLATASYGPSISIVGSDGSLYDNPIVINPSLGQTLTMGPGERYDVVIDFTGIPSGTVFTLMNNAPAPWPNGTPVTAGLDDRIMQFVVNGVLVSAAPPAAPSDKSQVPANLRTANPMVKLTDFAGSLNAGVTTAVKRQIILNEVSGAGGPVQVLFNNSHFDVATPIIGAPLAFGGPTETPTEGTTELITLINTTVDGHPIHVHLTQWQLVSRQAFDVAGYLAAYSAAWVPRGVAEFPFGQGYPGGGGSPNPYDVPNADGALGGNPAITPFLIGPVIPADPQEMGWKDDVKSFPGEVATYIVRYAPTDRPISATPQQLLYPFDPSEGPGYVWHCHIIDHEDMDMMRPLMIKPSILRYPQITAQPAAVIACVGDAVTYSVTATSATPIAYQWQLSLDAGVTWTNLVDGVPYSGTLTSSLGIAPAAIPLSAGMYRCVLTNIDGITNSNAALLSVNNCSISGTVKYNNTTLDPLAGFTVIANGKTASTDALGAFTITGVTSGNHAVTLSANGKLVSAINSTDAGSANHWFANPAVIPNVKFLSGDVNNDVSITAADALAIQRYFVFSQPFIRGPWVFWDATGSGTVNPGPLSIAVNGAPVSGFNILAMATGDFNGSFMPNIAKGVESNIQMQTGETKMVPAGKQFELEVLSREKMQVGAVSLIFHIESSLVDVKGVSLAGNKVPVTFNVSGDELRIGWNSTTPVTVQPDGSLLTLTLKARRAFIEGEEFRLTLISNPLNEIADGNFETVSNPLLKSDIIIATSDAKEAGSSLDLRIYPNPVTNTSTLSYTLPMDGNVLIDVHNIIGESVKTLVSEFKPAGKYTMNFESGSLPRGIYVVNLKLHNNKAELVSTIRVVINK